MANESSQFRSSSPGARTGAVGGEARTDSDLAFVRHCIANDINPTAWRAAVADARARWILPAGAGSWVGEAPRR